MDIWNHVAKHGEEIGWAAGLAIPFAAIFAVIVDILGVGTRFREALRQFRNRIAEESTSRLVKRIEQLRDYQRRLSSDRWLYLFSFQCIFLTLMMFSLAAILLIFTSSYLVRSRPWFVYNLVTIALFFFCLGGAFAWAGLSHVFRDTPEKMQGLVRKVGLEIQGLEEKLRRRLAR